MNNASTTGATIWVFKKAGLRETTLLLAIAWLIPFVVHLAPWAGARPLGAYLLPMFWTAFVAVYLYGIGTGLLVALFAPAVNLLVTGLPSWSGARGFELAVFVLATAWLVRRAPRLIILAPIGYLLARAASVGVLAAISGFDNLGAAGASYMNAVAGGITGLALLTIINVALVRFYPKE